MPFVSLEYIFMLVVLSAFNAFTSSNKWQKILLSCASIYYFAYWDIRFLILLLSYVAIAKVTELLMNNDSKLKKNIVCAMGIACCVLILATFKYANFFISSFGIVYGGSANKLVINLILPLGISFYTFQCISYIVDIYRDPAGKMPFIDLFLYIVFFPKLLAGPIMITADFKKQMENVRKPKFEDYFYGIQLFIYGMFKKIILADSLSDFISRCHEDYAVYSGVTLWVCALAYSVQIYCDFSGYSDMAIGSARILGVKIPPNFNWPYLSKNISIFWRNWHISLSSWLRDYIYIPLGGNRKGEFRTVLNKLITMLIGGLWHGANWTFVFWGALHGMLLIIHKLFTDIRIHTYIHTNKYIQIIYSVFCMLLTYLMVCIGWVFFRAMSINAAWEMIKKMFLFSHGISWYHPYVILVILVVFVWHVIKLFVNTKYLNLPPNALRSYVILFLLVWLVILFKPSGFAPFVYGQF